MMMPKVINETEKKVYEDGTYIKQYIVHAPEWGIYHPDEDGHLEVDKDGNITSDKVDYFVISESTRVGYLETLVFACDDQGVVENMLEVAGGRGYTADEVLTSFALIMMEAGYDPI